MPVKTATFRGHRFRVEMPAKVYGYTEDPAQDEQAGEYRAITIVQDQTPKQFLDTAVHEMMHASFPEMSEEDVTRSSQDIARLLWRLGYRRPQ